MNKGDQESTIKKILTTEVKYLIAVAVFIFGVVTPYFDITRDIALIQKDISIINTNHEAHIQDILQEMKDMKVIEAKTLEKVDNNTQTLIKLVR